MNRPIDIVCLVLSSPCQQPEEASVPTGTPRTPAEKRADELLDEIERSMKELRKLVSAGAEAERRLEKVRAELYTGAASSPLQPAPV